MKRFLLALILVLSLFLYYVSVGKTEETPIETTCENRADVWGVCFPPKCPDNKYCKEVPLPCWCTSEGSINPFNDNFTLPEEAYPLP